MARVFLVVMDSVGCGGAPDAETFGDSGANTLGHIAAACAAGQADDGRKGPLVVPNMAGLGLGAAMAAADDIGDPGIGAHKTGAWAVATEVSQGKDTPSGHWELAGLPVPWNWHYFPDTDPAFPDDLIRDVAAAAGTGGTLANTHASGIPVIDAFGPAHVQSGWPICYTSADSVFQIAAHEEVFGLDRLYDLCRAVAPQLHGMRVGRVIARPFVGTPGAFRRTGNRKDFAIAPPGQTICDLAQAAGRRVHAIGKIGDIFSGRGIDETHKGGDDAALMDHLDRLTLSAEDGALVFANFVEFDTLFGHQRDVAGYARQLEWFDARIGDVMRAMRPDDLLILTADHGNDPTFRGTDHTRERVPVLIHGPAHPMALGHCGFADVGATVLGHLGIERSPNGKDLLNHDT